MELDWLDILYKIFEVAIIPILAAVSMYLVNYIKAQKNNLIKKTENETLKKYIELLDKTISDCVIATNQTYVDALKKKGSFDVEAQKYAFQQTLDAVMSILTDDAQKYLSEGIKDLDTYIKTKIESQVAVSKQQIAQ